MWVCKTSDVFTLLFTFPSQRSPASDLCVGPVRKASRAKTVGASIVAELLGSRQTARASNQRSHVWLRGTSADGHEARVIAAVSLAYSL